MACTICNEECVISDHRKRLKVKCRICAITLQGAEIKKNRTKIGKIKDRSDLKAYEKHKSFITQIFNLKLLLIEDENRYPEIICRQCLRKIIQKLKEILPKVLRLKSKGKDKEEFEQVVYSKWDIPIMDFPIHSDLREEAECGEPSPDDRTEPECDAPSIDESDMQIYEDEEQAQSYDQQQMSSSDNSLNETPTNNKTKVQTPITPTTSKMLRQTPLQSQQAVKTPTSTTPTTRKRLTNIPMESPQDHDAYRKESRYSKAYQVKSVKRRHKIQLTKEDGEKMTTYIQVGNTGINLEHVKMDHRVFAKTFLCVSCNLLICDNGQVLPCGHKYCVHCLQLHTEQSSDCIKRCGLDIKNAARKEFTEREKEMHQSIKVICSTCKSYVKKEHFAEHSGLCNKNITRMSPYLIEKTEALTTWSELKQRHTHEEWKSIEKHLLKKLQRNLKSEVSQENDLMSVDEAGAFRQFTNTSSRTYKKMYKWFRKKNIQRRKSKVLPEYIKVLQSERDQMPGNVEFQTRCPLTDRRVIYSKMTDFRPRNMKESYESIKYLYEDISPNLEGVFLDPLRVYAKQIHEMLPVITGSLERLEGNLFGKDEPLQVIIKVSQDGLGSAPEIKSKKIPVLPDKVRFIHTNMNKMFFHFSRYSGAQ